MQGAFQIPVSFDTGTNKIVVGNGNDYEPLSLPPYTGADASMVVATTNPVTGGIGFNGVVVDMNETPDDTNTAGYPVGTLFISPEA